MAVRRRVASSGGRPAASRMRVRVASGSGYASAPPGVVHARISRSTRCPWSRATICAMALMGVGEMIGMRWILWRDDAEAGEVPEHVFEEMYAFVRRGLGAS